MKYKKGYIKFTGGYVRFKKKSDSYIEINWSLREWAIPFSVDFNSPRIVYVRFLCVSLIYVDRRTK